jgi:hypothetical protein
MNRARGRAFAVTICFLVSACASTRNVSTENATPAPLPRVTDAGAPRTADELVVYAERIRWLAPNALEKERANVEQDYHRRPTAINRLQLALLLSLRRTPFRDDGRARELVSEVAREPGEKNEALRSFAMLLLQDLDDRWAAERMLDEERKQRLVLQKKLDQLKAIEEEMDRRATPSVVPVR